VNKILRKTNFGNRILRKTARRLTKEEILSKSIQDLISEIRYTLQNRKYGIGLAAPQVGKGIALSVVYIRPTKMRPDLPKTMWADLVLINPEIKYIGDQVDYWEGCISLNSVFAKVPRYKQIKVKFTDERGHQNEKEFSGLLAHVIQHETDHLNGILFVDKVKDPSTYVSGSEYKKHLLKEGLEQYEIQ
jgi:peptide deformylase